jgi:hypothetical protein
VNGVTGMGIFHDSNGNGAYNSTDELIALVQGYTTPIPSAQIVFV